jgi:hypothetical protein
MELKKELLEFLEANNLFGLEDRENAEGVVDSYLKVYKKQLTLTDVSTRELPPWVRPLITIITMSLVTVYVIYKTFYVC